MTNYSSWEDIVKSFPTTPFLFIGSGLTRRYLNLPNWTGLLEHFCKKLSDNEFKYQELYQKSEKDLAILGELLESEFNDRWFNDTDFQTKNDDIVNAVKNGTSPFKAEIAYYIKSFNNLNENYLTEINAFKELSEKSISGIITTNYDNFLENNCYGYKVFNSQEELIASTIQSIGEIYKIHGSVSDPKSIIITNKDYKKFDEKCTYLAAKLLTIFAENPIIFIGYSISDKNIRKILTEIIKCAPEEHLKTLEHRFIFLKRNKELKNSMQINKISVNIGETSIPMTEIETDDFLSFFKSLKNKKSGFPVKILRRFKEELYLYALTRKSTRHCVVSEYDPNIPEDELMFSLGVKKDFRGLVGINRVQWYRDILTDDLKNYSSDQLLDITYQELFKKSSSSAKLPVCKHLYRAKKPHPNIDYPKEFDDLLSNTIKKSRSKKIFQERSVVGIIKEFSDDSRISSYIPYLKEEEIDKDELKKYILGVLSKQPKLLSSQSENGITDSEKKKMVSLASKIRRLINIYDWLEYGKKLK